MIFDILHPSLPLMLIYCWDRSVITNLIAVYRARKCFSSHFVRHSQYRNNVPNEKCRYRWTLYFKLTSHCEPFWRKLIKFDLSVTDQFWPTIFSIPNFKLLRSSSSPFPWINKCCICNYIKIYSQNSFCTVVSEMQLANRRDAVFLLCFCFMHFVKTTR
jgi:hypothetical protein